MSAVKICRTQIGFGVISRRRFGPGEDVGRISGDVVHDCEFGSDYCLDLQDGTALEIAPPYRYLNHSCEPNCELVLWEFEDESVEPWLHTLTPIAPGDELTIDYAWPSESAIACHCGSRACRGWVVAASEIPHLA